MSMSSPESKPLRFPELKRQRSWSSETEHSSRLLHELDKQHSWFADAKREAVWLRSMMDCYNKRTGKDKRVTDNDIEELRACIELGFGFGPDVDPKLYDTFPALRLYCAINKQFDRSSGTSSSVPSLECESDLGSSSSGSFIDPGDDPETVKTRLKQWAKLVACSIRQFSGKLIVRGAGAAGDGAK